MWLAVCLACPPAEARTHKATYRHHHHRMGVSAQAAYADIVIDANSGRILHATDPDGPRHPASLTKMMTLYLTFQALENGNLRLDQTMSVSANAAEQSPSKLGLRRGQRILVRDAILGVVTESANDAAMVLGETIGGSESRFAQMMTQQARQLGMENTTFRNPSGLPNPAQVTTARDMAILGTALIHHYPQFYPYFSRDSFVYAGIDHHNHNHLMDRYDGMDGIKTGYIRASGFNLVASAVRGSTRLVGVVFGGHSTVSRDNQMAQLLDQSFDGRTSYIRVASAKQALAQGDSGNDSNDDEQYVTIPAKGGGVLSISALMAPGEWGIQVGAYSDPAIGRQALASLVRGMPQLLGSAGQSVEEVSAGGVSMYRARLTGIDEKTARSACAWLTRKGRSCLTVAPQITSDD